MTPIAVVRNRFRSARSTTNRIHVGVAFDVRVAGQPETHGPLGYFTRTPPKEMTLANRVVLDLALQRPCRPVPIEEATDHTSTWRGRFHTLLVRPLVASRSSDVIERELATMLRRAGSIIDIACGDDTLVLNMARRLGSTLMVGNDICHAATGRLRRSARISGLDIILTNHDILDLPYAMRFDIALAKNVLHHIPNVAQATAILDRLRSLAGTLALVEYEDPRTSRMGRFWNSYYEHWLGDGAAHQHHFLTETKLRRVLLTSFSPARIEMRRIWTVKGYCLLAVIEFPQ
jgi:2-polyprenyl-3-methyl-5-hydroxy-6-metoxy-1,4-benzoquinol methylase